MRTKAAKILIVEDNPGDVDLIREGLAEARLCNELFLAEDGDQAMEFLLRQGEHGDAPRPDLILLDLNMPGKDGRQVLAEIKGNPDLCRIPVVVLTSSKAEEDVLRSYDLHANCYITKPVDLDKFLKIVQSIKGFWFSVVTLSE